MQTLFLKPQSIIEPLICQWPAWLQLISPHTSGFYFKNRYTKILQSFIKYPQIHQDAHKHPDLLGGFFVDLSDEDIEIAKDLLDIMQDRLKPLIELADDITSFREALVHNAIGNTMESLYELIPNSLLGTIELIYDIHHYPQIRFIEQIIYHRFFNPSLQSFLLSRNNGKHSFSLSTPRLKNANNIFLPIPFDHELVDTLAMSRTSGLDLKKFCAQLNLTSNEKAFLSTLFTPDAPVLPNDRHYLNNGIRIRYFGHACILIQTLKTSILIDPLLNFTNSNSNEYFSFFDLPDFIDYVLITHTHQDHMVLETLLQIRHKIKHIIVPQNNGGFLEDPSLKIMLKHIGFKHVHYLGEFEKIETNDITIMGLPFLGEHGDLNIKSKLAYHIKTHNNHSFLFAVDSNNIHPPLYSAIHNIVSNIDTLFIGMECSGAPYTWTYGPLSSKQIARDFEQSRRLSASNAEKAIHIVDTIKAKNAYVYAMGMEPWLSHILGINNQQISHANSEAEKFIQHCHSQSIHAKCLYLKEEIYYP